MSVPWKALWLDPVVLVGLYYLLLAPGGGDHLQDKFIFTTGCDSGFEKLLGGQLDILQKPAQYYSSIKTLKEKKNRAKEKPLGLCL